MTDGGDDSKKTEFIFDPSDIPGLNLASDSAPAQESSPEATPPLENAPAQETLPESDPVPTLEGSISQEPTSTPEAAPSFEPAPTLEMAPPEEVSQADLAPDPTPAPSFEASKVGAPTSDPIQKVKEFSEKV